MNYTRASKYLEIFGIAPIDVWENGHDREGYLSRASREWVQWPNGFDYDEFQRHLTWDHYYGGKYE